MESRQAYDQAYAEFVESIIQNESYTYSNEVSDTDSTSMQHSQHIAYESLCNQIQQQETSDGGTSDVGTSGAGTSGARTSSEITLRCSQKAEYLRLRRQKLRQQETPEQTAFRLSQNAEKARLRRQNKRQRETSHKNMDSQQAYTDFVQSVIPNESDMDSFEVSDTASIEVSDMDSTSGGGTSGAGTPSRICLQRSRKAETRRLRLQREPPEEKALRLSQRAEESRLQRQHETSEEKAVRRSRQAEYARLRRQNLRQQETPEQRALRLSQRAANDRLRKQNKWQRETPEERALRLAQRAAYVRLRRQQQTPEQRAEIISHVSAYGQLRYQNKCERETPEERAHRLAHKEAYHQTLRHQKTPEQRALRLSQKAAYEQLCHQNQQQREIEMKSKNVSNGIQEQFNPEGLSSSTEELSENSEDEIPLEKIKVENNVIFTEPLPLVNGSGTTEELFQNNEDEIPLEKIKVENNDIFVEPLPVLNIKLEENNDDEFHNYANRSEFIVPESNISSQQIISTNKDTNNVFTLTNVNPIISHEGCSGVMVTAKNDLQITNKGISCNELSTINSKMHIKTEIPDEEDRTCCNTTDLPEELMVLGPLSQLREMYKRIN